ncbi:MAG TPA: hypothetical protein VK730_12335 [Solirubrobacteraceae bacterium]|jgi:hypothetical protein|nr:hypothetical protein [Solirubrobacteraceae bacterium]
MTSPILPFNGPSSLAGSPYPMPLMNDAGGPASFQSDLSTADRLLASQDGSGTPPPEVLDQVAAAGRISREMRESGHELRFSKSQEGRVTVELADREGKTVKSMSISEALEIAAGKPVQDVAGKPWA